ncbi:hypothetical protein BD779DRAFT_1561263 [Infundibulicybe gibba]|nr:hypothetical protein BD779DRAFT_1561263 [Infundibulicybe gibba]
MPTSLPLELLHMIFLQAAESSTSSCYALCRVSSWLRHLALPLLYRTVSVDCIERLDAFDRSITSIPLAYSPSSEFRPADAVRHLWVPFDFDPETLKRVMRHCGNLTHLATQLRDLVRLSDATTCPSGDGEHAGTGDLHVVLLQTRASHASPVYCYPGGIYPLFDRITHLRLEDPIHPAVALAIVDMPCLTHLAAPYEDVDKSLSWAFHKIADTSVEVFVLVLMRESLYKSEFPAVEDWVCKSHE